MHENSNNPEEDKGKDHPYPLRLGALKKPLTIEAEAIGIPLSQHILNILVNRHESNSPEVQARIESLEKEVKEKTALIDKAVKKLSEWGMKI